MRLLGVVLAGGRSSRFGSDKALALWNGQSLLDRAIANLKPHCDAIVISGRAHGGYRAVMDRPAPDQGPLGGLAGALFAASEGGFDALLSLPCDTPVLPTNLFMQLHKAGGAAFVTDCPVIGIWPANLAKQLEALLIAHPGAAMRRWVEEIGAIAIDVGPIANINRTGDLDRLEE